MISIKYIPLFRIAIGHGYYTDGKCRMLGLVPSAAGAAALRQCGLRFLPAEDGGTVYAAVEKAGQAWKLKANVPTQARFQFLLLDQAGHFTSLTQMPAVFAAGKCLHFSNLSLQTVNGNFVLARDSVTKSFSADDLIDRYDGNTYRATRNGNAPALATLQEEYNGITVSQEVQPQGGLLQAAVPLQELGSGLVTFGWDGGSEKRFYLMPSGIPSATIGAVDIIHQLSQPAARRFLNANGVVTFRQFNMAFAPASPRWRYRLSRQFNKDLADIQIEKTNGGAFQFSTVPGPSPSEFIATSNQPIPLREQPYTGISLRTTGNNIVIPHLPNPVPAQLTRGPDGQLYADMLITI